MHAYRHEPRSFAACRTPEPGLEQLLADPLIRLVMRSDGVHEADIRALIRPAETGGYEAGGDLSRTGRPGG